MSQRSPSITHAHGLDTLDPRETYTYNPQPAAAAATKSRESASRVSRASSPPRTVTRPHGRDPLDPGQTYIYRADERPRPSAPPTYHSSASRRSDAAPTTAHRSSASQCQSHAPTHHTSTSRHQPQAPISRPSGHNLPIPIPSRAPARGPPPSTYRTETRRPESTFQSGAATRGSSGFSGQYYDGPATSWNGTEDEFEYLQARMSGFSLRR